MCSYDKSALKMKEKYKKFHMVFDKRFKNLILCSNLNCDGGVTLNRELLRKKYKLSITLAPHIIRDSLGPATILLVTGIFSYSPIKSPGKIPVSR